MRIGMINHGTPHPSKGGSGHWVTIYTEFLAQYHDIVIIRIKGRFPEIEGDIEKDAAIEERWRSLGVSFVDVLWSDLTSRAAARPSLIQRFNNKLRRRFRNKVSISIIRLLRIIRLLCKKRATFDDCTRLPQLPSILRSERIDILIAHGPLSTMYAAAVKGICKVSISAEGPHINRAVRYQSWLREERRPVWQRWISGIENRILCWQEKRAEVQLLKDYTKVLFAGQHYLRWAMKLGLKGCSHIPLPVFHDESIYPERSHRKATDTFNILMIGHLRQTSNRTQLPMLLDEILPAMERLFHNVSWVIRIVGEHDSVVGRYATLKQHPNLDFAGPIHHSDPEFAGADVLFVPVTARTGPRTKILHAFAHGLPVVAHVNNQLGIAELVHYGNCILGETGFDLAVGLRKLYHDPELARRLGSSGRKTYEACYAKEHCCEVLHNLLKDSWAQFNGSDSGWWEK